LFRIICLLSVSTLLGALGVTKSDETKLPTEGWS